MNPAEIPCVLLLAAALAGGCGEAQPRSARSAHGDDAHVGAPAAAGGAAAREGTPQIPGGPPVLDVGVDLTKKQPYPGARDYSPEAASALTEDEALDGHSHVEREEAVLGATGAATVPSGPQPRMSLVEGQIETADFGEVQQGYKASHVFRLKSDGEANLIISRLKPSCGCTAADVKLINADDTRTLYQVGDPIPPGTEFEVETAIVTDGRQGPMSTYVTLFSNEPKGFFNVHLKADVKPVLVVQPDHTLNFGALTSADRVEGSLKVTTSVLEPYLLKLDDQFVVEPLTVQVVPIDPNPEGKAKEWDVKVALGPNIPEGLRNYPLRLLTDVPVPAPKTPAITDEPPTFEARIFIQAQVMGLVSAEPSFLSFGMVRPGQVVERSVKVVCHDDFVLSADVPITLTGLRGEEFPYRDAFSWKLTKLEDGTLDFLLKLEGMPEDLNGSFGGVITLAVAHPHKAEVQIRFSGVCRLGLPAETRPPPQAVEKPAAPPGGDGGGGHR